MKVFGQLERAQFENLTADPTGVNLVPGLIWYRSDLNRFKGYDGAAVIEFADLTNAQTFSNKILTGNQIANFSPDGTEVITVPVATDTIALIAEAQTLSNKTLAGAVADYIEYDHQTTPATPAVGKNRAYFKDDNQFYGIDSDGNEFPIGSGAGDLNTLYVQEFQTFLKADDMVSGNNAAFDGGGTMNGVITDNSVTPLNGTSSLVFTAGASSANDYFHVGSVPVPIKARGNHVGFSQHAKYDGPLDTMQLVLFNGTTNEVLDSVFVNSTEAKEYVLLSPISLATTELKLGFQAKTGIVSGNVLEFVDFQLDQNPFEVFVDKNLSDFTPWTPTVSDGLGTLSSVDLKYREEGDSIRLGGTAVTGTVNGTSIKISLPPGFTVSNDVASITSFGDITRVINSVNAREQLVIATAGDDFFEVSFTAAGALTPNSGTSLFASSEKFVVNAVIPVNELSSTKGVFVKNSSAQNSEVFSSTSNGFGPGGFCIRFLTTDTKGSAISYVDGGGATDPYYEVSETDIYDVNFTGVFTANQVQRGISVAAVGSAFDPAQAFNSATNSPFVKSGTSGQANTIQTAAWSGIVEKGQRIYVQSNFGGGLSTDQKVTITKKGVTQVTGVPFPQKAYISFEEPSATNGGAGTVGAFGAIPYNTYSGDFGKLDGAILTLPKGKYCWNGSQQFYRCSNFATRVRDIDHGVDLINGVNGYAGNLDTGDHSQIIGEFTLSETTQIQIEGRVGANHSPTITMGVGNGFGVTNVFGSHEITKVE